MDKKIVYIQSVNEFIERVQEFKKGKTKAWYRGHPEHNYMLEPSIYRAPYTPQSELELMNQFKSRAIPFLNEVPTHNDYWEWLFLMQHYKVPTRLLDWTESPLIALAFAVIYREKKGRKGKKQGAHIWCLDPLKLNEDFNSIEHDSVPSITANEHAKEICDKDYAPATGTLATPVAVYGPQNNPRIVGQKGVFTIFPGKSKFSYDAKVTSELGLKIIIKDEKTVEKIANELYDLGISESMIYPELDSVSSEIKREYEKKVKKVVVKKAAVKKVAKKKATKKKATKKKTK